MKVLNFLDRTLKPLAPIKGLVIERKSRRIGDAKNLRFDDEMKKLNFIGNWNIFGGREGSAVEKKTSENTWNPCKSKVINPKSLIYE
jgi:hypothetical protein